MAFYRKRWPAPVAAPRDPLTLPSGPPPPDTHGRVGWGWVVGVIGLTWIGTR